MNFAHSMEKSETIASINYFRGNVEPTLMSTNEYKIKAGQTGLGLI